MRVPPDVLMKEHEKFQKHLSPVLKGSLKLASNKNELQQRIQNVGDKMGLGELAAAAFSDASERLETFKLKRTSGMQGANKVLQDSLFAVARFAAAYSNILEAVSSAAGPYTEIGYQTMTIVLIVSLVNKTKSPFSASSQRYHRSL